jgi:hypothetical protein
MGQDVLRPNAAGDLTQFPTQFPASGSHYDKVDEATSDGDSTYIQTDSAASTLRTDLFNLPSGTGGSNIIDDVVVKINAEALPGFSPAKAATAIKTNSVQYNGALNTLTQSYTVYSTTYVTNPNTGSAWTWAQIDALQTGTYAQSQYYAKLDEWSQARVTQCWVEVDWHQGVVKIVIDWVDAIEAQTT